MRTLVELLTTIEALGDREAVRHWNGLRTRVLSYRSLYRRIARVADHLREAGLGRGDRVLLWGENRPEWLVAFWAGVARGVELVPVDARSSAELVDRIARRVDAKLLVHGPGVPYRGVDRPRLSFDALDELGEAERLDALEPSPDDVVEIVFTSGTTGEPKGLVHRHRHLAANLAPFRSEIDKYRRWAAPFQPVRILDLLPLSHLFGQALGAFIPVFLGGAVVFTEEMHPASIVETIRRERVSVLVAVPRLLETLRSEIERRFALPPPPAAKGLLGAALRWWRYRAVHAAFGWKFWAVVVGGARLAPEQEEVWARLGFVVVQGYGLTEASPVVAANHPFHARRGSIGKPLPGQEVRIAPDGEILVRGPSVVSEVLGGEAPPIREGWLHTGDLGRMDEEGRIYFLGRKKDVIVTPEGLNVYPEDVETLLDRQPEVEKSCVVAVAEEGGERVHAALVLADPHADPAEIVRRVNRELEPHQRIRSWTVWPEEDFPRTPSTLKVRRGEVRARIEALRRGTAPPQAEPSAPRLVAIVAAMSGRPPATIDRATRLDEDLGLSSLDRVDLLSRLEEAYGVELDEDTLARIETVGELEDWIAAVAGRTPSPEPVEAAPARAPSPPARVERSPLEGLPRWARRAPIRWLRAAFLDAVALPVFRHYIELTVEGLERLDPLEPPALFAANHASHLDTLAVLAALPRRWRRRIAPAMAQDYFRAYLEPGPGTPLRERIAKGVQYWLACLLVGAYPLPQHGAGVRRALRFTGELVDAGDCPLVYPEGIRTPDGRMRPFRPGIGLMAVRLQVPVVPLHLAGTFEILSVHDRWPRRGRVRLRIGAPLRFAEDEDYREAARVVEEAVPALSDETREESSRRTAGSSSDRRGLDTSR